MASSSGSPCAACKFLRRKCTPECVFAPYFPSDQPHKFANVHKIFGASNIAKILNDLPAHQREDSVNSLAYEADARVKDPVYGCVGAISLLQRQISQLQQELSIAHADLARLGGGAASVAGLMGGPATLTRHQPQITGAPSSLGMGMGRQPASLSMQLPAREPILSRQQMMLATDQQSRLTTTNLLLEQLERETQLTREQLIEQLARAGGGSLEAGLAALGLVAGSMQVGHGGQMGYLHRSTNGGGDGSSGGGGVGQS